MTKRTQPTTVTFATVEMAGDRRLILELEDGRYFGVDLPEPLEGELPARAELKVSSADEAGVPQGAAFVSFITD
ncbi:hypothetical protein [Sphingomonas jaspsi]|uniref:hypothetical protein n=1 Tax=Sphingomonas jaspsi TaxID=392409 RepID=UPI0004B2BA1D|nr:hypothetical protein [Sphingomonas jaspsi]